MRNTRIAKMLKAYGLLYIPELALLLLEIILFYLVNIKFPPFRSLPVLVPVLIVMSGITLIGNFLQRSVQKQIQRKDEQLWHKVQTSLTWWGTYRTFTLIKQLPVEEPWARILARALMVWMVVAACAVFTMPVLLLSWVAIAA